MGIKQGLQSASISSRMLNITRCHSLKSRWAIASTLRSNCKLLTHFVECQTLSASGPTMLHELLSLTWWENGVSRKSFVRRLPHNGRPYSGDTLLGGLSRQQCKFRWDNWLYIPFNHANVRWMACSMMQSLRPVLEGQFKVLIVFVYYFPEVDGGYIRIYKDTRQRRRPFSLSCLCHINQHKTKININTRPKNEKLHFFIFYFFYSFFNGLFFQFLCIFFQGRAMMVLG